jgi:hypothetical protein
MLEDHAHLFAAEFLKSPTREGLDIDVVDPNMPVGDVMQLVDRADCCRLTGPDRPITTKISPSATSKFTSASPTTWSVNV